MQDSIYSSIELIPNLGAKAVFQTVDSGKVFREDEDIAPVPLGKKISYMPWGADNEMPYKILDMIEKDETLSTCQMFNAEVCYGNGLRYNTEGCTLDVKDEVDDFFLTNDIAAYFLGVSQDFKHFGFAVSVIILTADGKKICQVLRKEACYCRLTPVNKKGKCTHILYANWRKNPQEEDVEVIPLLDINSPWRDLQVRMGMLPDQDGVKQKPVKDRVFAVMTRVPTPDSTYYPIPYYGSLFRGNWYNIKQLIGMAKESKLKNSAPIKYQIEISKDYWKNLVAKNKVSNEVAAQKLIAAEKKKIIDFLTGVENSGKVWFTTFYVTPDKQEHHEVKINKIESDKEGGDWETDIIEAVNMICFTMRVHSNLVGSVPGKAQTNNSGSDKRELYTIAHALQKPYHDLLFVLHRIIIRYNGWKGAFPECPFVMLTTLDENKDAKTVTTTGEGGKNEK